MVEGSLQAEREDKPRAVPGKACSVVAIGAAVTACREALESFEAIIGRTLRGDEGETGAANPISTQVATPSRREP